MLTGNVPGTAEVVAREVWLGEVRARHLPEDKVSAVGELWPLHVVGGMLGDGVNDAPALAAALMAGDLTKLPYAVRHEHAGRGTRSASMLRWLSS